MFKFSTLNDTRLLAGTSKVLNANADSGRDYAHFRGALIRLFGEPLHKSDNAEDAFEYLIQATDIQGNNFILVAYEGASGPAIGGTSNPGTESAAIELLNLISETTPEDFEEVIYYYDEDIKITYGCRNGQCFYSESPM